ncbi:MAG TPA: hypothetical protein VFM35_07185, partial [Candidatus Binatia bacterium]|nr:hypothetical protein [Candidatus Binatia bacterium]
SRCEFGKLQHNNGSGFAKDISDNQRLPCWGGKGCDTNTSEVEALRKRCSTTAPGSARRQAQVFTFSFCSSFLVSSVEVKGRGDGFWSHPGDDAWPQYHQGSPSRARDRQLLVATPHPNLQVNHWDHYYLTPRPRRFSAGIGFSAVHL